jgi:hypothetical protein
MKYCQKSIKRHGSAILIVKRLSRAAFFGSLSDLSTLLLFYYCLNRKLAFARCKFNKSPYHHITISPNVLLDFCSFLVKITFTINCISN